MADFSERQSDMQDSENFYKINSKTDEISSKIHKMTDCKAESAPTKHKSNTCRTIRGKRPVLTESKSLEQFGNASQGIYSNRITPGWSLTASKSLNIPPPGSASSLACPDIDGDELLLTSPKTRSGRKAESTTEVNEPKSKTKRQTAKKAADEIEISSGSESEDVTVLSHEKREKSPTPPPSPGIDNSLPLPRRKKRQPKGLKKAMSGLNKLKQSIRSPNKMNKSLNTSLEECEVIEEERPQMIRIRGRSGTQRFPMRMHESFRDPIRKLAVLENVEETEILLMLGEKSINPSDTPGSLCLHVADIIEYHVRQGGDSQGSNNSLLEDDPDVLTLRVQAKTSKSRIIIPIRRNDPMQRLMNEFANRHNIGVNSLTFQFDGETIQPLDTPEELDLEDSFCIDVIGI